MNTVSGRGVGDGGDTECKIQVCESVRGRDVYIVQSVGSQDNAEERTEFGSVNDHLVELMLIVSAARRASAERICAVVPYYPYCRQTRKQTSRVPISAADVAQMLEEAGVDHVVTIDVHAEQSPASSPRCAVDLPFAAAAARFFWRRRSCTRPSSRAARHRRARAKGFSTRCSHCTAPRAIPSPPSLRRRFSHRRARATTARTPAAPTSTRTARGTSTSSLHRRLPPKPPSTRRPPRRSARKSAAKRRRSRCCCRRLSRRGAHGKKRLELIGEVAGSDVIIVDDIIDSGNTVRANPPAAIIPAAQIRRAIL